MALRYIDLANEITSSLPPLPIATMGSPLLTPLRKPLHQARVMIVASAGVHLAEDPPFAPINDMTYRRLPTAVPASRLRLSHPTPVRRPGEQDINVVYPYQRLAELVQEGIIGGATEYHLSLLGAIKRPVHLVTDMAPRMAADARAAGADIVLHIPL